MSQVFNLNMLMNKQTDVTNVLQSSYIEESYFVSTLEYISEMKNEVRHYTKELHIGILESANEEVLNESFSVFFTKIKEIIEKFLKFIKSLFDRFVSYLHKMISSDKYLIKNKDIFRKFNSDHEFEIEGFFYTFENGIPVINALREFNKDFVELDFDVMNGKKDNKEQLKYIQSQQGKLSKELSEGYYDKFRGEVLGKENYEISQVDFAEELFEIFRDGYSKKNSITIDQENLLASLSFFENYKEVEKQVKKQKDNIDKEYKAIEKSIQGLISRNKDYDVVGAIGVGVNPDYEGSSTDHITSSQDVLNKMNLFVKAKMNQVVEMSAIHSMAFSYKLDAITECYKQDKKILYTALTEIQKDKNLR